ncbi:MAG: DMT family transporter, partial [Pseudomonadota bacterium]
PDTPRLAYAAGFVTAAAVGSWVFLFELDLKDVRPDLGSVIGVVGLGVAPSALAPLAYFALVKRAGATFLSLTNYAVPALASIIGLVLFKEKLGWNAFAAFGLILFGVWLAQSQRPTKLSR